jgi:hypothetical protein
MEKYGQDTMFPASMPSVRLIEAANKKGPGNSRACGTQANEVTIVMSLLVTTQNVLRLFQHLRCGKLWDQPRKSRKAAGPSGLPQWCTESTLLVLSC